MLTSGDVVDVDFGSPQGRETGFVRPAIVLTAQRLLDRSPSVIQVVPFTATIRQFETDIVVEPDSDNGLNQRSAAQCAQMRAISAGRVSKLRGNVGRAVLRRSRLAVLETIGGGV